MAVEDSSEVDLSRVFATGKRVVSRTAAQPAFDTFALGMLRGYVARCGADDPDTVLRLWFAGEPENELKHVRVLCLGLLFELLEREIHADRSRLYVAWAEAGFADPAPSTLLPLSEDRRDYALKAWRASLPRLRSPSIGIEPARPIPAFRRTTQGAQERQIAGRSGGEGAAAERRCLERRLAPRHARR